MKTKTSISVYENDRINFNVLAQKNKLTQADLFRMIMKIMKKYKPELEERE